MNLRRIALLTAVAQLLSLLCGLYNFAEFLWRAGWQGNMRALVTWPTSILAQAMMVFFLFHLFARQKES